MAKDNSADKLINVQLQQLAAQVANWAAQLDFAKERFKLMELPQFQHASQMDIDRLAFDKAQATWENAYKEASLTGTYQGQPTMEWLTQQAQLTGVLNGQQTLQGKLTDAQIAQMNEQMRLANEQFLVNTTGYHQGRPTFEREQFATQQTGYYGNQATMARQQMEAELSGYYGGRSTLEREKFGAEQTQNYLQLLSSLQGPGNAFKQLRVLNATPGGLQGLVNSWAGTYGMQGFGSQGAPGQAQISDLYSGYTGGPQAQGYVPPNTGPPGMPGQWGPGGPGMPGMGPLPGAPPPPPGVDATGAPLTAAAPPPPPEAGPYVPPPVTQATGGAQPLSAQELHDYEAILARENQVLQEGLPSILQPGSGALLRLVAYLNRGAQQQSASPLPGSAGALANAGSVQQAVANSGPWNAADAAARPPSQTAFSWTPQQAAAGTVGASTYGGPPFASTAVTADPAAQQAMWYAQNPAAAAAAGAGATNNVNVPGYTYSPEGTVAPPGAYNYSATQQGHTQVYPPGVTAPPDQQQVSTQTPVSNSTANSLLANAMPGMGGTLSPSQINAENYNDTNPYAQEMMWAQFEDWGWDPQAARAEFMKSLPKYAGPTTARVQM